MPNLTWVDALGSRYYRSNVESVKKYINAELGLIAAAPLIHTYSPTLSTISALLAVSRDAPTVEVNRHRYKVKRFLTVQSLDASFYEDEDNNLFRPTIKPHYALAKTNRPHNVYDVNCQVAVLNAEGIVIYNNTQNVHAHHGLVSPALTIDPLKQMLLGERESNKSLFFTSYVIDKVNNQVLITQHCLLKENEHTQLRNTLEEIAKPTLEALAAKDTAISCALTQFNEACFEAKSSIERILYSDKGTSAYPNINTYFLLKSLSIAAVVVGFVALAACGYGLGVALIASAAYPIVATYILGAIGGIGVSVLGFFGQKHTSDKGLSLPVERFAV